MVVRRGVQEPGDLGELLEPAPLGLAGAADGKRALVGDLGGRPVDLANTHDLGRSYRERAHAAPDALLPNLELAPAYRTTCATDAAAIATARACANGVGSSVAGSLGAF